MQAAIEMPAPDDLVNLRPIATFASLLGEPATQTIVYWIKHGVKNGSVKLRGCNTNGWHTTEREVLDFIRRKTTASGAAQQPATDPEIARRAKVAMARLVKQGCGPKTKSSKSK